MRIRSGPAKPRSTRLSASFPKRAGIRSTARRARAISPTRWRRNSRRHARTSSWARGRRRSSRARCARSRRRRAGSSFETCPGMAKKLGHPLTEVRVDSAFRIDIDPMIAAAKGAGLVFFNNPNNPTATVHGARTVADFVERVHKASPDTVVLIDEAYHDYVTDPSYQTAVPLALETPNVLVTRTFSKVHGMAGMRIGYGIGRADTISKLARLKLPYNVSVCGIVAAITSLHDQAHIDAEVARNTEVRAFTVKALEDLGFTPTSSQANFLFVGIQRPAKEFRDACAKAGVLVGRDFPPFEKTHARISIGTMDEMARATDVFRNVRRPATSSAGQAQ